MNIKKIRMWSNAKKREKKFYISLAKINISRQMSVSISSNQKKCKIALIILCGISNISF